MSYEKLLIGAIIGYVGLSILEPKGYASTSIPHEHDKPKPVHKTPEGNVDRDIHSMHPSQKKSSLQKDYPALAQGKGGCPRGCVCRDGICQPSSDDPDVHCGAYLRPCGPGASKLKLDPRLKEHPVFQPSGPIGQRTTDETYPLYPYPLPKHENPIPIHPANRSPIDNIIQGIGNLFHPSIGETIPRTITEEPIIGYGEYFNLTIA